MPSRKDHKAKSGKSAVRSTGLAATSGPRKTAPGTTPSASRVNGAPATKAGVSATVAKPGPELRETQAARKAAKPKDGNVAA